MSTQFAPTPFEEIKRMVRRFIQRMKNINEKLPQNSKHLLNLEEHFSGFYLPYSELRRIADKFEGIEKYGQCLFIFGLEDDPKNWQ
jgi:hypothetical protein